MKKLFVIALILFFASPVFADQWCEWSGTEGENCQSDNRGFIMIDSFPTKTPAIANAAGWYKVTITQPTIGEDQVKDAEVWGFADNAISLTWTVRDLTATELDKRIASPMSVTDYYQWKAFIASGLFTLQQLQTYFQANDPDMITAYQARARLIGD